MEPITSIWLPLIVGGIGYCAVWLVVRMGSQRTLPQQHAEVREQVIRLSVRWIDAEQERLYCEHELARLRESVPDEQSLWIVHSLEHLQTLPPAFVHLARRFGFKVPDHDHGKKLEQPPATTVFVSDDDFDVDVDVDLPMLNAWGAPSGNNGSNGHASS